MIKVTNCSTVDNTINGSLYAIKQARAHMTRLPYSSESGSDLVTQIHLCDVLLSAISAIESCVSLQIKARAMAGQNTRIH
jgi:hypothetical protein